MVSDNFPSHSTSVRWKIPKNSDKRDSHTFFTENKLDPHTCITDIVFKYSIS